jgi:hypothetical protein
MTPDGVSGLLLNRIKDSIDWSNMTQDSFSRALQAAIPDFRIWDKWPSEPAPEGYVHVQFHGIPTSSGFRLSIKVGESRPKHVMFSSEGEAAAFLGQLHAEAMSRE